MSLTKNENYVLELYVTGMTARSTRAILNITKLLNEHLPGRYELEVIDLFQRPSLEKSEQLIATPTLIRKLPLPIRKFVGDMSDAEQILLGLGLKPKAAE